MDGGSGPSEAKLRGRFPVEVPAREVKRVGAKHNPMGERLACNVTRVSATGVPLPSVDTNT